MRCRLCCVPAAPCSGALSSTMEQSALTPRCHRQQLAHNQQFAHLAAKEPHKGIYQVVKKTKERRDHLKSQNSFWPTNICMHHCSDTQRNTRSLGGLHTAQRQSSSTSSWEKLLNREREMAKLNIIFLR